MDKFLKKHVIVTFILGVVAILALALSVYLYMQNKKTQELLTNPTLAAQIQAQDLLAQVGKLMDLPKDDQPTIATVSDVSKLQGQPFFLNAKNGFKVLLFTKSKKAILYDPFNNKIVEVAPINFGSITPSPAISVTPVVVKKVVVTPSKSVGK